MTHRILIATEKFHHILILTLQNNRFELDYLTDNSESLAWREYIGIIISNNFPVDKEIIDNMPNLRFIGRLGSGLEIIDTSYAKKKGIMCLNSPEGNANAVGEHALGMLLSLLHKIPQANLELKQLLFKRNENTGRELSVLTIGIIGYGNNGSNFAKKLADLGAQVLAYDILPKTSNHPNIKIAKSRDELFLNCQCISLHIPLNNTTQYYIDQLFIESMQQPFYLINCARGKLININTLYEGLASHKIIGACIDVWEEEPIKKFSPDKMKLYKEIINMPQVIATPHIAGYTQEATYKMSKILAEKIIDLKFK